MTTSEILSISMEVNNYLATKAFTLEVETGDGRFMLLFVLKPP